MPSADQVPIKSVTGRLPGLERPRRVYDELPTVSGAIPEFAQDRKTRRQVHDNIVPAVERIRRAKQAGHGSGGQHANIRDLVARPDMVSRREGDEHVAACRCCRCHRPKQAGCLPARETLALDWEKWCIEHDDDRTAVLVLPRRLAPRVMGWHDLRPYRRMRSLRIAALRVYNDGAEEGGLAIAQDRQFG
jgi:hypothetical protein